MDDVLKFLRIAIAFVTLIVVGGLGIIVIFKIATGTIDLNKILSSGQGSDGTPSASDASMSRFQLMVFTFVIALSVLYVVLASDTFVLPDVPGGLLALLGISATSYAVGKGLDVHEDTTNKKTTADVMTKTDNASRQRPEEVK